MDGEDILPHSFRPTPLAFAVWGSSAALAIDAARGGIGGRIVLFQPHILWLEGHGAIFEDEGGNTDIADSLRMVEDGTIVAQMHESTHIMNVGTDVDDLESLVALDLLVDESAIGAGGHTINLNHCRFPFFCYQCKDSEFLPYRRTDSPFLPIFKVLSFQRRDKKRGC